MVVSTGLLSLVDFPIAEPRVSKTKLRVAKPTSEGMSSVLGDMYTSWIGKNDNVLMPNLKDQSDILRLDPDGHLVDSCGALLPKAYARDESVPERPWICPVRSCRRLYESIADLGSHFKVSL